MKLSSNRLSFLSRVLVTAMVCFSVKAERHEGELESDNPVAKTVVCVARLQRSGSEQELSKLSVIIPEKNINGRGTPQDSMGPGCYGGFTSPLSPRGHGRGAGSPRNCASPLGRMISVGRGITRSPGMPVLHGSMGPGCAHGAQSPSYGRGTPQGSMGPGCSYECSSPSQMAAGTHAPEPAR